MAQENSYGIIALRQDSGCSQVLLVLHNQGHWSFPKGRIEPGEDPKQCAIREFEEETSLKFERFLSDAVFIEHYQLYRNQVLTQKSVTYFLAEASGTPIPQAAEVTECRWVDISLAAELLTHPEARHILAQVQRHLE